MAAKTASLMDWGFTDTRSTPWARRAQSFSAVIVSGRPASTVNSEHRERSTYRSSCSSRSESWAAVSVVGVPPPIYTVRTERPSLRRTVPASAISRQSSSKKGSTSFKLRPTSADTKEQ